MRKIHFCGNYKYVALTILSFSIFVTKGQSQKNMDTTLIIKKERQINADTKKVWTVLTNSEYIEKWLGVKTQSKWTPKSHITFSFIWDGKEHTDKGVIIQFEKEKIFSYSYWSGFSGLPDKPENYSKITFELETTEKGMTLKLTHSDFKTEIMYQHSDKNWEGTINEIKKLAEEETTNH